jgi:hypothetical protein
VIIHINIDNVAMIGKELFINNLIKLNILPLFWSFIFVAKEKVINIRANNANATIP